MGNKITTVNSAARVGKELVDLSVLLYHQKMMPLVEDLKARPFLYSEDDIKQITRPYGKK